MRRRLFHPFWVDLPGLLLLGALAVKLYTVLPLPSRLPVHFDFAGRPNRWGMPVEAVLAVFLPLLMTFFGHLLLNEIWAREERTKHFNWFTLILPPFLGFFTALSWGLLDYWAAGATGRFAIPWVLAAVLGAGTTAVAVLLELVRPFLPKPGPSLVPPEEHRGWEVADLARIMKSGNFVYWESQDPAWLKYLIVFTAIALAVGGAVLYGVSRAAGVLYWGLALLLFLLYGGLRITLDREGLRVRLGVVGLPLYRLRWAEIVSAEVVEFSPLRDFGGWGIRLNAEGTWGFFYRGNKGVLIRRSNGRKVLLGSDDPARLLAVILAGRGQ